MITSDMTVITGLVASDASYDYGLADILDGTAMMEFEIASVTVTGCLLNIYLYCIGTFYT